MADGASADATSDGQGLVDVEPVPDSPSPAESGPLVDAPADVAPPEEDGGGVDAALDAADGAGLDATLDDAGLDAATEQDAGLADAPGGG
jgi:hypothetical protein